METRTEAAYGELRATAVATTTRGGVGEESGGASEKEGSSSEEEEGGCEDVCGTSESEVSAWADESEESEHSSSVDGGDVGVWATDFGEEERQEVVGEKRGWWLIDTVNVNAWGADDTAGRGRGAMEFLRRTKANFVGLQETRLGTRDKCCAGMEAARKEKWKVKLVEAHITETGYASAGVAVAGRSHFGMTDPHLDGFMYDNTRIAHMHLGAVCRGGIHLISVYLISCEGMSERNRGILLDLARLIKAIRGPWVVMGDWNMPPEVLEAAGWVGEVEGKIVSPKLPTCKGSVIDYFVVDRRLMHAVLYVKRLEGLD